MNPAPPVMRIFEAMLKVFLYFVSIADRCKYIL